MFVQKHRYATLHGNKHPFYLLTEREKNQKDNGIESDRIQMTACSRTPDSETWCCGVDNTECCNSGKGMFTIPARFGEPVQLLSTGSSTGLSEGAKAGIGVGVALGTIAVIGTLTFLFVRRIRWKNMNTGVNDTNETNNNNTEMAGVEQPAAARPAGPAPVYPGHTAVQSPQELEGNGIGNRVEKPAELQDEA